MYHPTDTAISTTTQPAAGEAVGREFDPYALAEAHGIRVVRDPRAPRMGFWDPDARTIRLRRGATAAHDRGTLTLNLGFAVADTPDVEGVWQWTGERIMPAGELQALASVTPDRTLWARALIVSPVILLVYLLITNAADVV